MALVLAMQCLTEIANRLSPASLLIPSNSRELEPGLYISSPGEQRGGQVGGGGAGGGVHGAVGKKSRRWRDGERPRLARVL